MNRDFKLLAEAYNKVLLKENSDLLSPEEFINKVKKDYSRDAVAFFGKVTEGDRADQLYAAIFQSEEYSDGDRMLTDDSQWLVFNRLDQNGRLEQSKYLSKEQIKPWERKAMFEYPELNKHLSLDFIGFEQMSKEEARQVADKWTNWSHDELMKQSMAYEAGFEDAMNNSSENASRYKDGTLNSYLYEFGQYEAQTSH